MENSIQISKESLRKNIRAKLGDLSPERRRSNSERLCVRLREEPFFQVAAAILFFAPLPDEPDLWPALIGALADGKTVTLPCFDATTKRYAPRRVIHHDRELVLGRFGIREPAADCAEMPISDLDLALVPGIAFDRAGRRLGRGRGFYDRMLAKFVGKKIGIALDEQVVDAVPAESRDVRMDFILTPTRCVRCNSDDGK